MQASRGFAPKTPRVRKRPLKVLRESKVKKEVDYMKCLTCGSENPGDFNKYSKTKCCKCRAEYARQWRLQNPDYKERWRANHPTADKEYYDSNVEYYRQYAKERYERLKNTDECE